MKTAFFPSLLKQTKVEFITKKQNSYMCLSSEGLRLLDMVSYLAAGTRYSKFLKAFNVQKCKGFRISGVMTRENWTLTSSLLMKPSSAPYST